MRSSYAAVAILLLASVARPEDAAPVWKPQRTWVFAVSATVLKFDRAAPLPRKSRHDIDLIETFKARGVPEDQITFLKDKYGAIAQIHKLLPEMLKRTGPGDTVIVYFQGHGNRDIKKNGSSSYYFINYDAQDGDDDSYWYMRNVFDEIDQHFQGSQAIIIADCCCSGGLLSEAKKRKSKVAYACLASVFAHNSSSSAWTFTEAITRGFQGNAVTDLDGDGKVTLHELSRVLDQEMAYVEDQKAAYCAVNGFDDRLQIAHAGKKSHSDVGKYLEAKQDGYWYRAQVLAVKEGKHEVAYLGFDQKEWVKNNRLREYHPKQFKEGTHVLARNDDDKWLPAVVKKAHFGMHLVHFDRDKNEKGVLDEWVPPDGIKLRP